MVNLSTLTFTKRFELFHEDRVSNTHSIQLSSGENEAHANEQDSRGLKLNEAISVATTSADGKKIFIGTFTGRVLMFESGSFGLIHQQSYMSPLKKNEGRLRYFCRSFVFDKFSQVLLLG